MDRKKERETNRMKRKLVSEATMSKENLKLLKVTKTVKVKNLKYENNVLESSLRIVIT